MSFQDFTPEKIVSLFESKEEIEMPVSLSRKVTECKVCLKAITGDMKRHMRTHNGEKPFVCEVCHKQFAHPWANTVHKRMHLNYRPFECKLCGKSFHESGGLKRHIRSHTGETPYECDICHKRYKRKHIMLSHKRIHSGELPFCCNICGRLCRDKRLLDSHMKSHISSKDKKYKCNFCGKGFSVKGTLIVHIRIHTGEKPFICFVCGAAFAASSNLKVHKRCHVKLAYDCPLCPESFTSRFDFIAHIDTHPGNNFPKFECDKCNKTFYIERELHVHKSIHKEKKHPINVNDIRINAQCDICHKKVSKKYLSLHRKTHTDKHYLCEVCNKTLYGTRNYTKHLERHYRESD